MQSIQYGCERSRPRTPFSKALAHSLFLCLFLCLFCYTPAHDWMPMRSSTRTCSKALSKVTNFSLGFTVYGLGTLDRKY